MKIASWNVNSIKAHTDQVLAWFKEEQPDVVCMQEIKCEDHAFPAATFEELGYSCAVFGQKTYNGVAIVSKYRMEDVSRGLPNGESDDQARFIAATVYGATPVVVASIYLPNGNPAPGPKYDYKLSWINRLTEQAKHLLETELPVVLLGDYNVIPSAEDARNAANWSNDALYLPETRAAFSRLKALGFTEAFRATQPFEKQFSFWDYQAGAWQKNNGIRIDHALLSSQAADLIQGCSIQKHVRGWDKPSDHVPIIVTLAA